VNISDRSRRLLVLGAGAFALVGAGVAVSSFVLDDGDPTLAAVPARGSTADARPADDDDYSLSDVTCAENIFGNPLATGDLVNIADDNRQFRVSVVFRVGDDEIGRGMQLMDELTPGESEGWTVYLEQELDGEGLDCDIRVDDAT